MLLGTILAKCIDLNLSLYQLHELPLNLVPTVRPDINALSFQSKGDIDNKPGKVSRERKRRCVQYAQLNLWEGIQAGSFSAVIIQL